VIVLLSENKVTNAWYMWTILFSPSTLLWWQCRTGMH